MSNNLFTLTGLALEDAVRVLDQELPPNAYKAVPIARGLELTDIDPNVMKSVLNTVFGLCGYGWGFEYDPQDIVWENRLNDKYQAVVKRLKFWYKLQVRDDLTIVCAVYSSGASENVNLAYALKGAITSAIGAAASAIGFQESVYLGYRSHKTVQTTAQAVLSNGNGNGKVAQTAPRAKPSQTASVSEPAVPAPEFAPEESANPGLVTVHFGRYKGKTLEEIWAMGKEGQGWIRWCANTEGKGGFTPKGDKDVALQRMAQAFLMLNVAYAG